jgi:hypothetical protein
MKLSQTTKDAVARHIATIPRALDDAVVMILALTATPCFRQVKG